MKAFCTKCGGAVGADDSFCGECGTAVAPPDSTPASSADAAASPRGSGSSSARWWIPTLLLVAVTAAGGTYAYLASEGADVDVASVSTTLPLVSEATPTSTAPPESTTTSTLPLAYSEAQLAELFGDAVFRVETHGCGYDSIGTAFAVGPNHLVTNAHVVENDPEPTLVGRSGQRLQGRVIGYSQLPDVAVIEVSNTLSTVLEWAAASTLSEGDRLVSIGYPVPENDFTVTPGAIISFQKGDGIREAIRTDANLDRGNSGGPALTAEGRVAGVVTEMADNSNGLQFVALVYTSAVLRDIVENAIARPADFPPQCEDSVVSSGGSVDDYPNPFDPFWTVILMSVDSITEDFDAAVNRMYDMWALDIPADILLSDDFPSLNPGYWVVYAGRFTSTAEARSYCQDITPLVGSCYPRLVSWDASQR